MDIIKLKDIVQCQVFVLKHLCLKEIMKHLKSIFKNDTILHLNC